jgi:hypothetical protein
MERWPLNSFQRHAYALAGFLPVFVVLMIQTDFFSSAIAKFREGAGSVALLVFVMVALVAFCVHMVSLRRLSDPLAYVAESTAYTSALFGVGWTLGVIFV